MQILRQDCGLNGQGEETCCISARQEDRQVCTHQIQP